MKSTVFLNLLRRNNATEELLCERKVNTGQQMKFSDELTLRLAEAMESALEHGPSCVTPKDLLHALATLTVCTLELVRHSWGADLIDTYTSLLRESWKTFKDKDID